MGACNLFLLLNLCVYYMCWWVSECPVARWPLCVALLVSARHPGPASPLPAIVLLRQHRYGIGRLGLLAALRVQLAPSIAQADCFERAQGVASAEHPGVPVARCVVFCKRRPFEREVGQQVSVVVSAHQQAAARRAPPACVGFSATMVQSFDLASKVGCRIHRASLLAALH